MLGGPGQGQGRLACRGEGERVLLEAATASRGKLRRSWDCKGRAAVAAWFEVMKLRALSLLSRLPAPWAVPSLPLLQAPPFPLSTPSPPASKHTSTCTDRISRTQ